MSVTEEVDLPASHTLNDWWGIDAQQGPVVDSPTDLRATVSYGSCHCDLSGIADGGSRPHALRATGS